MTENFHYWRNADLDDSLLFLRWNNPATGMYETVHLIGTSKSYDLIDAIGNLIGDTSPYHLTKIGVHQYHNYHNQRGLLDKPLRNFVRLPTLNELGAILEDIARIDPLEHRMDSYG